MLTLYAGGQGYPIKNDDYYIRQLASGMDELIFEISIRDELYPEIVEEASIQDRDQMNYLVKQIDGGNERAKVVCQLDLDEWKSTMKVGYTNGSATVGETASAVAPGGWRVIDRSLKTFRRTIEGDYTPLEILVACVEVYNVRFRWDNKARTVTIIDPDSAQPLGAFATRELNLKDLNYKGKSQNFATRLYAVGKDGMTFADINGGKAYVDDNTYSSRIICAYWKDDRYTVKESLLQDAKSNLHALAVPQRSYDCDVIDLASTNPELYAHQNFSLFSVCTLIDDAKKTSINHQVVERWEYPHYPIKNKVILSTQVPKIQNQITQITQQIQDPNSTFRQIQQAAIDNATANILSGTTGYVVFPKQDDGSIKEILIMDTPDIATATKVWRWNSGGLGYSSTGYNGPYGLAMTQDGAIVADFMTTGTLNAALVNVENLNASNITAGTLNADLIKAGSLTSQNGKTTINMATGTASLFGGMDCDSILIKGTSSGAIKVAAVGASLIKSTVYAPYIALYKQDGSTTFSASQSYGYDAQGAPFLSANTMVLGSYDTGLSRILFTASETDGSASISIMKGSSAVVTIAATTSGEARLNGYPINRKTTTISGTTINYWGWT